MSLLRRRRLSPELERVHERFLAALAPVEGAKEAIVEAVPQARFPGRELSEALAAYDQGLAEAEELMGPWRHPAVEERWAACSVGLRRARAKAAAGRADPQDLGEGEVGFESLLELVQSYLDPLEPFAEAEERFLALRTRSPG